MGIVTRDDRDTVVRRDLLLQLPEKPVVIHPMNAVGSNNELETLRAKIGIFRFALNPRNVRGVAIFERHS